jgi:putrescine transport system substrate-binding protein
MARTKRTGWLGALVAPALLLGLAGEAMAQQKRLNIYNWSDYIGETTVADFEKLTGAKVQYDLFDSNEVVESKLLAGRTGYDIVVPTSNFLARQIKAGIFAKLDKAQIPNWKNLDPAIMKTLEVFDPGNEHGVPYMWGTNGLAYNVKKVQDALPGVTVDSWDIIFKPENAAKLAKCGITMLDAASEVLPIVLKYLGKDPFSENAEDIKAAQDLLLSIRPYIKYFHSSKYINDLASGNICIALGWSGDALQAKARNEEAAAKNPKVKQEISYVIPKEGTIIWFDMMAIPADAKNKDLAYAWINYILEPKVIADASNLIKYANAVTGSKEFLKPEVRDNSAVFPTAAVMARLFPNKVLSRDGDRLRTRTWTAIKKGKPS